MENFKPYTTSLKGFHSDLQAATWKTAKWGIIIFCVVHVIFELGSGNEKSFALPVIFNYLISAWYVKKQIKLNKFTKNPLLAGMTVACVVFMVRVILGIVYSMILLS